jgi:predicted HTH transcriptional regulator
MEFEEYNLLKRISEGEGQQLDFKYAITDSKKIARSISAFANSDGGILLIGVKDNGKIVGIKTEEEYYMIEQAALLYCKPNVNYNVITHKIENKEILEVIVYSSSDKLIYAPDEHGNWTVYIRKNDKNCVTSSLYIDVWNAKHNNDIVSIDEIMSIDEKIRNFSSKESFSFKELQTFLKIDYNECYIILFKLIVVGWVDFIYDEEGEKYKWINY